MGISLPDELGVGTNGNIDIWSYENELLNLVHGYDMKRRCNKMELLIEI